MKTYMADTHSLLWLFARPQRLGENAMSAFRAVAANEAELLVPVIVVAELIFAVEKKFKGDLGILLERLEATPNVRFLELTFETVKALRRLDTIPEMHDRIIVAQAIEHGVPLITRDETITTSGLVEIVW